MGLVESGVFFEVFSVRGEDQAFDAVVVHGGFLGALFAFGHSLFELDLVEDFLVACDDSDLGEALIAFSLVVEIRGLIFFIPPLLHKLTRLHHRSNILIRSIPTLMPHQPGLLTKQLTLRRLLHQRRRRLMNRTRLLLHRLERNRRLTRVQIDSFLLSQIESLSLFLLRSHFKTNLRIGVRASFQTLLKDDSFFRHGVHY